MRSAGLKFNISVTMVLLLACALVLGNLIVVLFWQREIVRGEVRQARAIVHQWERHSGGGKDPAAIAAIDLRELCRGIGPSCREVALVAGPSVRHSGMQPAESPALDQAVAEAARDRREIVRFAGPAFGGIFFGDKRLIVAQPLNLQQLPAAGVGMVLEITTASRLIWQHRQMLIAYAVMNVLLLTIIGLFRLAGLVVRPIERLVQTSESYDYGDGVAFFGDGSASEIGQLSFALNRMLARIEADREKLRSSVQSLEQANRQLVRNQKEMVRAEKLAAVGRLAAGLAHEIGNPIGIVQGYLELLENADLAGDDRRQFSRRAIAELRRIDRLIHQLLDFSRASSQAPGPVAVQGLLAEVIDMFTAQKRVPEVRFVRHCAEGDDVVVAGAGELRQVFLNCLLNAADSIEEMGDGHPGQIVIDCRCVPGDRPMVEVVISDNGRGIAADLLEIVFDPFYTTKAPGKGTGLGLSVSYSIIEAAGGRIWAESPGVGAAIHIELPAAGE